MPDESKPGVNKGAQQNNSLRVTWQATPKVKIAGTYKADTRCNCPSQIGPGTYSPEAARDRRFPRLRQEHGEVTIPITNRVLSEAVALHLFERWGDMHLRVNGGSLTDPAQEAIMTQMISVQEQSAGLVYRNRANNNNTVVPSWTYRAAVSDVTGTHNVKVGFNNGIPNRITQRATPFRATTNQKADIGLFVQDKISMNRLTLNVAGRFDNFRTGVPEQYVGPAPLTPTDPAWCGLR